jgi:hypothetical protein
MAFSPLMPPTNDTCDIYTQGTSPPAAPRVVGAKCCIVPRYGNIKPSLAFVYTHVIYFALSVDVRDNWPTNSNGDVLWVPNKTSPSSFTVAFVERVRIDRGGGNDYLRAYVNSNDWSNTASPEG